VTTSPWRIDAASALERWESRDHPSPDRLNALLEWFFARSEQEPPGPDEGAVAVPLEEELAFVYRVPEADVVVMYYVLVHERLMLVKEIEDVRG
jgi:hypothetical protein